MIPNPKITQTLKQPQTSNPIPNPQAPTSNPKPQTPKVAVLAALLLSGGALLRRKGGGASLVGSWGPGGAGGDKAGAQLAAAQRALREAREVRSPWNSSVHSHGSCLASFQYGTKGRVLGKLQGVEV